MLMGALNENVPANFLILLTAGIPDDPQRCGLRRRPCTSPKPSFRSSAQDDTGQQPYAPSSLADDRPRSPQRTASIRESISHRFRHQGRGTQRRALRHDPRHGQPDHFQALLMAVATSLKLPLCEAYVSSVAMGWITPPSRASERRRHQVPSGVMTVVAGWFITALGGFPDRLRGGAGASAGTCRSTAIS